MPPPPSPPTQRRRAAMLAYGLACHALFGAAVLAMIGAMAFGMSRSFGRVSWPWGALADAGLLAQFPLLHSGLLTGRGRKALGRLAPAGLGGTLSTTAYATIASVQALLLFTLWTPSGIVWWQARGATLALLLAADAAAWLMLLSAVTTAGLSVQTGYLGWLSVYRGRRPVYPALPVTGLFRLCRQPIYLAFALTTWAVPTWTPDQLALATGLTAYCVLGPRLKEARFRRLFPGAFEAYARGVPYFVPGWRVRRRAVPTGPELVAPGPVAPGSATSGLAP